MRIQLLAISLLPLLCSCVATSLKQTWKSPDYHNGPVKKVATVAVDERGEVRRGFENRFVYELQKHGTTALITYDLFSLAEIKADKTTAANHLREAGADAVIILRQVNSGTSYRDVRMGGQVSMPSDWYDYYYSAFNGMSSGYGSLKQTTRLETSLFDLKTGKRIWSGLTDTVTKFDTDRVAEMDKIVGKALAAMRKDGMIL
jgi:hypothetical protein